MATNLPPLHIITRVSPLIIRILGGNPGKFTLQGTNTYLIGAGPSRILIDTAQGFPSWREALSSVLVEEKCTIGETLITHYHHDHVGGIADLVEMCPGVRVYKHPAPESLEGVPTDILPIEDGRAWKVDNGATLTAIHTPGHTEDHCTFALEPSSPKDGKSSDGEDANNSGSITFHRDLFTGDAILGHGTAVFQDLAKYMSSLEKLSQMGNTLFSNTNTTSKLARSFSSPSSWARGYPGHGEVIQDVGTKIREYIEHRQKREDEVLAVLKERRENEDGEGWMTPREIVKIVYRDVPENLHDAAEGGVRQILGKLEGEGKVEHGDDDRWRIRKGKGAKV